MQPKRQAKTRRSVPLAFHATGLIALSALLSSCVSTQFSGASAISSNPWRTSATEALHTQRARTQSVQDNRSAFYVDCQAGDDARSGTSPDQAWRTVARAGRATLKPGQSLLFKRGCTFTGPLEANWTGSAEAPVLVGAYGEGTLPKIHVDGGDYVVKITGRHQVLQHLEVSAKPPPASSALLGCPNQPTGWRTGFSFQQGAEHNVVQYSRASGLTAGIHFKAGQRNKALHNVLVNNNIMSQNTPRHVKYDDDSGAWGVLLNANDNEVAYNYFEGNTACSLDYGVEGASVEVYDASNNFIHHNVSVNDTTFAELGGTRGTSTANNTFAFNLYAPVDTGGQLLVLRGPNSKWASNPNTKFHNNTGYLVTLGISCSDGCSRDILSAHNNILWARDGADRDLLFADAPFDEGHNVYWQRGGRPRITLRGGSLGRGSLIADPRFVDPANLDFRLAGGSPARGRGNPEPVRVLGVSTDLQGTDVTGRPLDLGALQVKN